MVEFSYLALYSFCWWYAVLFEENEDNLASHRYAVGKGTKFQQLFKITVDIVL